MRTLFFASMVLGLVDSTMGWGGYHQGANGYKFAIPGDPHWPTDWEFKWFKEYLVGDVFLKGETGYAPYTYSTRTNTPQPAVMVYPSCIKDIQKALRFARWHNMRVSVLSTGHHMDVRNIADNAVHVVMNKFNEKELIHTSDVEKHIKVGPGQTFGEISEYVKGETFGEWAIATGADSTVGPYGWATGGGHGYLSRMHGLGVDMLVSMRVVLANGRLVTASETKHSELFRSLRGSGGSTYGITVSMTFKLHPTPQQVSSFFGVYFPQTEAQSTEVMQGFHDFISDAPKEVGGYYLTMGMIPGNPVFMIAFCYGDNCDPHVSKVAAISGCTPGLLPNSCVHNSSNTYYNLVNALAPPAGGNQYSVSTSVVGSKAFDLIKATTRWVVKPETLPLVKFCTQSSVLGGKMKDIDEDGVLTSVSPAMRNSEIQLTCVGSWPDHATVEEKKEIVAAMDLWEQSVLRPHGTGWVYWNEAQHNFLDGDWQTRYWGSQQNYNRLLKTKKRYDPLNAITCYHCVGWDFAATVDPAVCPEQNCTCSNNPTGSCN